MKHKSRPEVIKLFSCSAQFEHEILNAHEYKNIKKFGGGGGGGRLGSDKSRMLFFQLINVKMPTSFMSRKNFRLSSVEHEKSFITSGPGCCGSIKDCLNASYSGISTGFRNRNG